MLEYLHISSLIHLVIAALLGILYVRFKSVLILPAIMIASLIGVTVGLEVNPFLKSLSGFAAILIVFVAGLELNSEFIRREKERVVLMIFIEAILFVSLFYILTTLLPLTIALTFSALVVASNEAFAIQISRVRGGDIGNYGLSLSVFEDALAVSLLSYGLFTLKPVVSRVEIGLEISILIALTVILYFLSKPFSKFINEIENLDTKILLVILYMFILISLSEALNAPEPIVIFIGALMLSWEFLDLNVRNAIENYFSLALIGFIATLPYMIPHVNIVSDIKLAIYIISAGVVTALLAFIVRFIFVLISSTLSGLNTDDSLYLATALANTGEFGLIVLAYLIKSTNLINPVYAYIAMIAYAVNLTIVSYIANRMDGFVKLTKTLIGSRILNILDRVSSEANSFISYLIGDIESKVVILEIALSTTTLYVSLLIYGITQLPIVKYTLLVISSSLIIVALHRLFRRLYIGIRRHRKPRIFIYIFRIVLLYVILAPLIDILTDLMHEVLTTLTYTPLVVPLIPITSYLISKALSRISQHIFK